MIPRLDNRTVVIGGTTGILGEWGPEDANSRYEGPITARDALVKSKNGAAVRIGDHRRGSMPSPTLVHAAGVESKLRPYPATFLGSSEITLAELALAYTIFLTKAGVPPRRTFSTESKTRMAASSGDTSATATHEPVLKPEIACEVTSCPDRMR